ncbi:type II and III secretion system protein family protein [Xenophilus arseniciresistens]
MGTGALLLAAPGALLAQAAAPATRATTTAATAAPAASVPSEMQRRTLQVGSQEEMVFAAGVERIAIADEAVAAVAITRQRPGSPAARLILTGRAPGTTTLMVWEKGQGAAHRYELQVQRRAATLTGRFADAQAHAQAREEKLAGYGDKAVLADRSVVDVRSHTVQVDVKVVEFNRSTLKQVGLNIFSTRANSHGFSFGSFGPSSLREATFNANGSIATDANNPLAQAFGLLFNFGRAGIGVNLGLLEGNGMARVLAEPTLVALSGQSANFLAGGELPIPVPQGLGTTSIEYKQFGIGLTVTPTVMSDDRIALKVAPEASDLDYSNALSINGTAVPAITTRRADTTVELGDGESFIIGGLVSRTTSSNADKVPLLGDIPVLGSFFRHNNFQSTEKELVIIVTPHLVKPLARNTDLQPHLPGERNERRNPQVWGQILSGSAIFPVPGFSP